jgi:hypothetical protein
MQKQFRNFTRKLFKNAKPFLKLAIIWLEIILEFISKIPIQILGILRFEHFHDYLEHIKKSASEGKKVLSGLP